jgi:uronate dehydrogenase
VDQRVLITGAAGRIGRMLRERLTGFELRLLDVEPVDGGIRASVTDLDAMVEACTGVDAVVHLGGIAGEDTWERIRDTNIEGTYCVFEAARRAGVRRVVYASSNHAVGFHENAPELPDDLAPRPDTFYGVSKVLGEGLGALYHDRHGMEVVCLRIGSCFDHPVGVRMLATWLSPGDCARLVHAALTCENPGFRTVWGISANTRRTWSLAGGAAIGYHPQDDAEDWADRVVPGTPEQEEAGRRYVGGAFTL